MARTWLLRSCIGCLALMLIAPLARSQDAASELARAKQEYEKAFEEYTRLATTGGPGNIDEALARYRQAYTRYQELLKAGPRESAKPSPTPSRPGASSGPTVKVESELTRATFEVTGVAGARYEWDFGDGKTQTTIGPRVVHTYDYKFKPAQGSGPFDEDLRIDSKTYAVSVKVHDGDGTLVQTVTGQAVLTPIRSVSTAPRDDDPPPPPPPQ